MKTYSGYKSVQESVGVLKDVPKLKQLTSTYYEVGNWVDGYKRMNDLAIWTGGASAAAKGYAAMNGGLNLATMYYDGKDLKNEYDK